MCIGNLKGSRAVSIVFIKREGMKLFLYHFFVSVPCAPIAPAGVVQSTYSSVCSYCSIGSTTGLLKSVQKLLTIQGRMVLDKMLKQLGFPLLDINLEFMKTTRFLWLSFSKHRNFPVKVPLSL